VQERNAIWEHAARTAAEASAHIRSLAATSPASAADAAWATADTLHAAAAALGSRVLRQAADSYDRAARTAYGRMPRPTPTGNSLRQTARLLARAAAVSSGHTLAQVTLITQLAALAEARHQPALRPAARRSGRRRAPGRRAPARRRTRAQPASASTPPNAAANTGRTHAAGLPLTAAARFTMANRAWCRPGNSPRPAITAQATRPDPVTRAATMSASRSDSRR
jgi:hypothetical protein